MAVPRLLQATTLAGCLLAACIPGRGASPTPTAASAASPTVQPPAAFTATPAPTATPEGVVYTVKDGDTISAIATQNHSTVDLIVKANNLTDADKIQVGQKLIVPPNGSAPASPAPAASAGPSSVSPNPSAAPKPPPP